MSSVGEIIASIATAERSLDQVVAGIAASHEMAEELRSQLSALGVERRAEIAAGILELLAEQIAAAAVIRERLERVRAQLEALRGAGGTTASAGTSAAGSAKSVPKPTKSHGTQQKRAGATKGPVVFSAPRKLDGKLTSEHRRQVQEYIDSANKALKDGKLSGSGRVRPSKDPTLKNAKDAAAARERARAEAAGEPYGDLVAAHLPDTTWTGTAAPPGGWGRHDNSINASIGSQSDKYPEGYRPSGFQLDDTWDTVETEGGDQS